MLCSNGFAQRKAQPKPRPRPAVKQATASTFDPGAVIGRTYTNKTFGFEVTFPDMWLIPDNDFEAFMKARGFDLSLKAPDSLPLSSKETVNKAIKRVQVLLTAYRSLPGSADNAIVRISIEDLSANPLIKDAVDYFDAMRAMFASMKLPADFKYSETQAEKLGAVQFGFLDADSSAGRKRMYATIKDRHAIMFTISYSSADDLETLREVLRAGNFGLTSK
jgi:hypothetical protein